MRHRNMRDAAPAEEALLPGKGAVDELIDDDKVAGLKILAQTADGGERNDVCDAAALERVDIGAIIDFGGRQHVAAPMARDEYDGLAVQRAETEFIGSPAEWAFNRPPLDLIEPVDLIEPTAADDADDGPGHWHFSGSGPRSCAWPRKTRRRQRAGTRSL